MKPARLEAEYRRFLAVAKAWQTLLDNHTIIHDTAFSGETFRVVAATSDMAVVEEAKSLLDQWSEFAALFDKVTAKIHQERNGRKRRESEIIMDSTYKPVPLLIVDETETARVRFHRAASTRLITREAILDKYDKALFRFSGSAFEDARRVLKSERAVFEAFPAGEAFRGRKTGFTDVILEYKTLDADSSRFERQRISAHGALVVTNSPEVKVGVIDNDGNNEMLTVYSRLKPLACTPLMEMDIYRLADVDHFKQVVAVTRRLGVYIKMRDRALARRIRTFRSKYQDRNPDSVEKAINRSLEAVEVLSDMDREVIRLLEEDNKVTDLISPAEARRLYGAQAEKNLGLSFERLKVASRLRLQGKK